MLTDEEVVALKSELETITAEKDALAVDLQSREHSIAELNQAVSARDSDIVTLKQELVESGNSLASLRESLNHAISAYKSALTLANPSIPADLIAGDSIEEVNQSLEKAKSLVSTVRASLEAELAAGKVPAGAPPRSAADLATLSPREKIQYAVKKGGKS